MAQNKKEARAFPDRPRIIDATPERVFLRAGRIPTEVAALRGSTIPDLQFLDVTGEANVATTLAEGHADAAVVPLDWVDGLVEKGAAAPLPLCGADVDLEGIRLHAIQGRPYAALPSAALTALVISPDALARLESLGEVVQRLLELIKSVIELLSRLNGILIFGIDPVDERSSAPQARCADFDFKYKVTWFTVNAVVTDVAWTKIGSPGAAVEFRASSSENPGPTYPIADQGANEGNPVYGHRQIDGSNTSEFQVPM